jgi:glycosyltransferase involved in cell wall biosynthesis
MVDIEDVMKADFIGVPYVAPKPLAVKEHMTIGWVLSPVTAGSGGQNTIVRFARYLKQQGHDVTFYIYEGVQPQSTTEAKKILSEDFHFDVAVRKLADYQESDAVFATGWETAYPVFNLETSAHKCYFIQDFEPYFYGIGSKSVLAENTYKMGFYGITAGKWLAHRMQKDYGMLVDYFDFGADLSVYRPSSFVQKQKKVVFYARPVTERRAFELGVIALDIFHQKHPDYTIEFIGWDVSEYTIPFPYVNRGILTHSELATLYQESVACLVLSLTNVSLLPLEVLAAGCIPVLNEGENNKMVLGENEYIAYAAAAPIQLAQRMSELVSRSDIEGHAAKAMDSVQTIGWEISYKKVESILKRELFE